MEKRRKIFAVCTTLILSLVQVGFAPASDGPTYTLQVGHATNEGHAYHIGMLHWDELLNEASGGRIRLQIHPNATLGAERDLIEGLQLGTVDISLTASAPLVNFSMAFSVIDLPYMFPTIEDAFRVLDGEIGRELLDALKGTRIVGLGFWDNGYRHISNSKREIVHPADLQGIKLRTMESEICLDTFRAMNANVMAMAYSEVYTALQQKTVDAQEGSIQNTYQAGMHEVQPYMSLTYHFYAPALVLMSQITYDSMSPEDQKIILDTCEQAKIYQREVSRKNELEAKRAMIDYGVRFREDLDLGEWRAAVQKCYDKHSERIGVDLIRRIQDAIAK
ncbi:MAG: DctP family TRAP transporter solute-binding subunit [Planctomycetota bacterium]|jgi:tripartite ATP-independent transporter DctP family solute receptor|nr:DctP family TRAP transporter solute-binding subunit [Planctomycetota bacterium]